MKKYLLFTVLFAVCTLYSQEQNIDDESVVIEFSFNPNLSDAFKLKTYPKTLDSVPKEKLNYSISPVLVKSDFQPFIKKAKYASRAINKATVYPNYLYLAGGLYGNIELDALMNLQTNSAWNYGFDISGAYRNKGIDEKRVDNNQLKTDVNLYLERLSGKNEFRTDVSYQRNQVNYYGLPTQDLSTIVDVSTLDTEQIYNEIAIQGDWIFQESLFSNFTPELTFFSDSYKSSEVNFTSNLVLKPKLGKHVLNTKVRFEYLSGDFDKRPNLIDANSKYRFINFGAGAFRTFTTASTSFVLGMDILLNSDAENGETDFYFLPNLTLSHAIIDNIMTFKAGLKGAFSQNTYASIVANNPFVMPTLQIKGTGTPLNLYAALDGLFSSTFSYEIKASYKTEKNKLLFRNTPFNTPVIPNVNYGLGNSFSVLYDDVNTFQIASNLGVALNDALELNFLAAYNAYATDKQKEAWNLPDYELGMYSRYLLNKWRFNFDISLVGERKDILINTQGNGEETQINLSAYADANLKIAYQFSNAFSAHLNSYNLFGNNYERFVNYQVQGFQLVGGISYKF